MYPMPGGALVMSFNPPAHRILRRIDSQSPFNCSVERERTRSLAFNMRVTAVPGYSGSKSELALRLVAAIALKLRTKLLWLIGLIENVLKVTKYARGNATNDLL